MGDVTARVTGASYLTWIGSRFLSRISNVIKNTVVEALEKQFGHVICDALNNVDGIRRVLDNIDRHRAVGRGAHQ